MTNASVAGSMTARAGAPVRSALLQPYRSAALDLPNRIAMAPMTRTRADDATGAAVPIMATYYAQRAGAGLIVSEGIWPHPTGKGEPGVPGLVTSEQVRSWRMVTDAVHSAGGRIFAQLWHVGRVAHSVNLDDGAVPVAPSAIRSDTITIHTSNGRVGHETPRQLSTREIEELVLSFASAARNAVDAGFDGVEIHGANGYLIQQFLAENTNRRTDEYSDRLRFVLEVIEATVAAIGADRTALRISPDNPENDIVEATPRETYRRLVGSLNPLGLAYLHVIERGRYPALSDLRPRWNGTLMANFNGPEPATREQGEHVLMSGLADLFSFGRLFISNPDLPTRFAADAPIAPMSSNSYGRGASGYIDYEPLR